MMRMFRFFSAFAALFFAALAPSRAAAQVNAEQVMIIGRNVLSMEDFLLAIQYFNQAIKGKPYLADPYYYRGLAKLSLDDFEGAVADETMALDRNKFKSEAYKVRGFALQNLGRDSLAVLDYDKGLEYDPTDRYFLFYKAVAQTSLKRYDEADSTFSTLLRRNPKFEDAWCARARLNLLRGDTIAAESDIEKTLSISRAVINAYLLQAQIDADRRNWKKALEDINQAVRLRPEETDLYINRAYLRYNDEDFFGAMADYNYALQLSPMNVIALFNRALLRTEVKELDNAAVDFSEVLRYEPDNFIARYNRGLVYLELEKYDRAFSDFQVIADRYPKFYPVYYALAECRRAKGDLAGAGRYFRKGEALVAGYVANPQKNPLDRPTIQAGASRDASESQDMSAEEVMERFNRLVTTSPEAETRLSFNDRIKGRVQDRSMAVQPEPMFTLTFREPDVSLRNRPDSYRELDDINQRRYLKNRLYLTSGNPSAEEEGEIRRLFRLEEDLSLAVNVDRPRPVDWFARGVVRTMLKNYDGAVRDFTMAAEGADNFVSAYLGRAYASAMLDNAPGAMADLDEALRIYPNMPYVWYNKGLLYYNQGDYTSAIQAFTEAINLDPSIGPALYNRGLSYMQVGNRQAAFADLSKAGELGVLPSYNLLKRMK